MIEVRYTSGNVNNNTPCYSSIYVMISERKIAIFALTVYPGHVQPCVNLDACLRDLDACTHEMCACGTVSARSPSRFTPSRFSKITIQATS